MKVLVATGRTQGDRTNDFHYCVEGELVQIRDVCWADRNDPDGGCGCGRAFAGLSSHRATTTALVADLPLDRADYLEAFRSSLEQQGFGEVDPAELADELDELAEVARNLPTGTVVGRRLWSLVVREFPRVGAG